MPNVISKLGNTLFQWQKGWPTAAHSGPGLDDPLRQAFERVVDHRIRPCLLKQLGTEQAEELISNIRRNFGQLRGSIHPGEVGRFCHAVIHTGLGLEHPEQTWRTALLPKDELEEEQDELLLFSVTVAEELDANRPHALPFPIRIWLPTLIGLLAGLLIGWFAFGPGWDYAQLDTAWIDSSYYHASLSIKETE